MRIRPGASTATLLAAVFLFTLPAFAAETTSTVRTIEVGPEHAAPAIEVAGNGEVMVSPDVAYLSLQVETHATTAEAASSQNAALTAKVVAALKSKLAAKGRVSTGGYSLSPEYAQRPEGARYRKPEIIGYTARNSIVVETGDLPVLGALIDSAIAAGANRINYLNFGLRNDRKARTEAITEASRDAQAQAHALAASLGVKLGHVLKASTAPQIRPMPMGVYREAAISARQVTTPIEPGQITVRATVSLVYGIE